MKFIKSKIKDCVEIIPNKISDNRGYFQRVFCSDLFRKAKLNYHVYQINNSFSKKKGTTRGLHYQTGFHSETKIMKCISGKLDLYVVDLRMNEKTYLQYLRFTLDTKKNNMVMVPNGCANGIQTLEDNTEIIYFVSNYYAPKFEKGINFNDPRVGIKLRLPISVITNKDKNWPLI